MAEYTHPVGQLLTIGDPRNSNGEWLDCTALGIGPDHIPDLIRMAVDLELNRADSGSLEVWAPLHAWRSLGILRAEEAIEPLLNLFHELEGDDWVGMVLPEVYGRIGPAAIPALKAYIADASHPVFPRIHAASGLKEIGQLHPEARDACVQVLMGQLEDFEKNGYELNAFLVGDLMGLKAVEAAPLMERAFAADRVDESIMGDWEDVQVELGLKPFREPPEDGDQPVYRPSDTRPQLRGPHVDATQRAKAKKKRKMERESRKKNRKRKK